MSLIEILRVLYDDILGFQPNDPGWPERDRCILSKGHGCLALYAILADKGFFPPDELDRVCRIDSLLGGHPERGMVPGIEASTGALGHGLSVGLGIAKALKLKAIVSKTIVILGDGEINEGAVWEAALTATKHRLDNLTAVIDFNKLQSYGPINEVLALEPLAAKWESFGFAVREVDGHDIAALREVFGELPFVAGQPNAIICHTVKGKGIPMAENNPTWHHKNKLKPEELASIETALGTA